MLSAKNAPDQFREGRAQFVLGAVYSPSPTDRKFGSRGDSGLCGSNQLAGQPSYPLSGIANSNLVGRAAKHDTESRRYPERAGAGGLSRHQQRVRANTLCRVDRQVREPNSDQMDAPRVGDS
jgi:hypothetical protein